MTTAQAGQDRTPTFTSVTRRQRDRDLSAALKAFVVGDDPSAATTSQIIEAGLAGYAVSRLTGTAAVVDERLTRARVTLAARHLTSKAVFSKLLTAWVDAGLEVLVFKGFALAEFTYPDPTWRTYSDIDVALRPPPGLDWSDLARVAAKVAVDNGFTVLGRPDVSDTFDSLFGESYHGPALIQVVHDRSQLNIDVHCRVVHNNHVEDTNITKQAAITDAVWRDSTVVRLAGIPVRIPSLVDSALVGLVVGRSWSTDSSHLRPHDYLDLRTLYDQGLTRAALVERARALGCLRTLRLFLRRCDPMTLTLDLRAPNALTRLYFDTVHAPEHGHRTIAVRLLEARHLPRRTLTTAVQLRNVSLHLRAWRRAPPLVWPAERLPAGDGVLEREEWRLTQFAVRRAFQLCGVAHPERRPDLAAAALQYALRARGIPVERRRDTNGPTPELELRGEPLRPTVLGLRK